VVDSLTLTIVAGASVAAGTYPLVITAAAIGADGQQAPLAVVVTVADTQVPSINFVVTGGHTCALTLAGAAYCWGFNGGGQLGNNDSSVVDPTPVAVVGGLAFQILSVSKINQATCGVAVDGDAYCWGDNDQGQLGDGTRTRRLIPTRVSSGVKFKSVALGNGHACALAVTGTAYCWGFSPNGGFGDGTIGERLTPQESALGLTFESIVAGGDFTCGLTPEGDAFCWGLGFSGQLGDGTATSSLSPRKVSGGLAFKTLAAADKTVCGLTVTGGAFCWGDNSFGTIGDGTSPTDGGAGRRVTPAAVTGGLTFLSLSAGHSTVCGVTDDGSGYCWGYNASGGVGDGTDTNRSSPTRIIGDLTFQRVSAGVGMTCGVTVANAVYCWGDNNNGDLGDGTTTSRFTPAAVRWK